MSFTALRVVEAGVVLYEGHAARMQSVRRDFDAFAQAAPPGLYVLRVIDGRLDIEPRDRSRLRDGIALRRLVSPFAAQRGAFAKPMPPSPYASVRAEDVATLLTDPADAEVYESCAASVVAWDGASLVVVPDDRPRVASVAESALRGALPVREAPVAVAANWPLLLVNAMALACVPKQAGAFPEAQRHAVNAALLATARRP